MSTDRDPGAVRVVLADGRGASLPGPVSARRVMIEYAAATIAALVLVAVGSAFFAQRTAVEESLADARRATDLLATSVVGPAAVEGLQDGDPSAVADMDALVRSRVLGGDVVRVKIWNRDGTIVYSDEPRLIGSRYTLSEEDIDALDRSLTEAELSDLSRPENRFERGAGAMLEVYRPIAVPSGERLLFETYSRYESVTAASREVGLRVAALVLGTLALMVAVQLPLTLRMVRQLRRSHDAQQRLLLQSMAAGEDERRRIAAVLHDGLAQDLAAASLAISRGSETIDDAAAPDAARALDEAEAALRQSTSDVRALLVELLPPRLQQIGLSSALEHLARGYELEGPEVVVQAPDADALSAETAEIVYRLVQEGLRNAARHSGARHVWVSLLVSDDGGIAVSVRDDGSGIEPKSFASARDRGHLGLEALADLAIEAGGLLALESRPGAGTTLRLELPTR